MDEQPPRQGEARSKVPRRAATPRKQGTTAPNNLPAPRPVRPTGPVGPVDPEAMAEGMKVAPGDPFVRAAYDRTNKVTTGLVRLPDGVENQTDALALHQQNRRSRAMAFTYEGTQWKAGFAKEYGQTPVGQLAREPVVAPRGGSDPSEVIVQQADPAFEAVFRILVPKALLEAEDRMYGLNRTLEAVYLYYFPREEGATSGILAVYADGPASRRHLLYLQTNIRHASPVILEQMARTFAAAVPRAQEASTKPSQLEFWKEFERSLYEVRATFRNSQLRREGLAAKARLTSTLQVAGDRVDRAVQRRTSALETWIPVVASFPIRVMLGLVRGISQGLVGLIRLADRPFRGK